MKRTISITAILVLSLFGTSLVFSDVVQRAVKNGIESVSIKGTRTATASTSAVYTVIGWNDLGMHCISPSLKEMAILPPYNNLMVQIIEKGSTPKLVTSGITVQYSLQNNKSVTGKTNFWQYVQKLFGVNPAPGIGLTGNGLSGTMKAVGDHFEATGIPVLPFDDRMRWNPYQIAVVTAKNSAGKVIGTTQVVIPVSDELNCQKCHAGGSGSVETNILSLHDSLNGTNLMSKRPVLCSNCHGSNALGMPGDPNLPSLSEAMHSKHASLGANAPTCYDCHPGPKTNCSRSAIEGMGPEGNDPMCERCHGSLQQVADSIQQGRDPWLQEPTCAQCHGADYATGTDLYRNSRGHGGVFCSACHNSPHAWYPSLNAADNYQPLKLQQNSGPIGKCTVCHTSNMTGINPHHASGHPADWREKHGDVVERQGTSSCTACHGANLTGGAGPSCYTCHGNEWSGGD
jgi:hypothetical protein